MIVIALFGCFAAGYWCGSLFALRAVGQRLSSLAARGYILSVDRSLAERLAEFVRLGKMPGNMK